jgi:hypothetical protein
VSHAPGTTCAVPGYLHSATVRALDRLSTVAARAYFILDVRIQLASAASACVSFTAICVRTAAQRRHELLVLRRLFVLPSVCVGINTLCGLIGGWLRMPNVEAHRHALQGAGVLKDRPPN